MIEIKYIGEQALSYLVDKCKETFALITHSHTASEIGADEKGAANDALNTAKSYTDSSVASAKSTLQSLTTRNNIQININYEYIEYLESTLSALYMSA